MSDGFAIPTSLDALAELMRERRLTRVKTADIEVEMHTLGFMSPEPDVPEPTQEERSRAEMAAAKADPTICRCGHPLAEHSANDDGDVECLADAADGLAAACDPALCNGWDRATVPDDLAEPPRPA